MNNTILKYIFLYLITTLSPALSWGQCAKIDSLLRIIRIAKAEEVKIDALNKLVEVYAADKNKNSESKANFYASQALSLAQKAKYRKGIADAMANIAYLDYEDLSKVEKTIDDYKQALTIYEDLNDKENTLKMLNLIGNFYYRSQGLDQQQLALAYYEKMLRILEKNKRQDLLPDAYEKIGEVYFNLKDDEKAIFFFKRALANKKEKGLNNEANERVLARYERIKNIEKRIQQTDVFTLSLIFFLVTVGLVGFSIYSWSQHNRIANQIKRNEATAS